MWEVSHGYLLKIDINQRFVRNQLNYQVFGYFRLKNHSKADKVFDAGCNDIFVIFINCGKKKKIIK